MFCSNKTRVSPGRKQKQGGETTTKHLDQQFVLLCFPFDRKTSSNKSKHLKSDENSSQHKFSVSGETGLRCLVELGKLSPTDVWSDVLLVSPGLDIEWIEDRGFWNVKKTIDCTV